MFDINTSIGHWPFRRLPNTTVRQLRAHLEGHGITGAAVAHTHGLFYKNCHDANFELAEALSGHEDFFVGVATLNPAYSGWDRDLAQCVEDFGFRALRLVPQYHGYESIGPVAAGVVNVAAGFGLPIIIPHRVVDVRQRHWMDTEKTVTLSDIQRLCRDIPAARVVFTEYAAEVRALCREDGTAVAPNLFVETSRMRSAYGQVLARVVRSLGPDHVLFGTGAPFKEITPGLLKLAHADLDDEARAVVSGGAARGLLGLE